MVKESHQKSKNKNDRGDEQAHKSHRIRKSGASAKKKSKSVPIPSKNLSKEQKKINNPKVLIPKRSLCSIVSEIN